jgi:glycine C-acetyltransferase
MEQLEDCLKKSQDARFRLVVSDAVFSMDGEVAKLPEIGALADAYESSIMIDECHGTGVLGKKGRGAIESTDMMGKIGKSVKCKLIL